MRIPLQGYICLLKVARDGSNYDKHSAVSMLSAEILLVCTADKNEVTIIYFSQTFVFNACLKSLQC